MTRFPIVAALAALIVVSATTAPTAASAEVRYCSIAGSDEGLAELKASNISCRTARRVYNRSLDAAANGDDPPTVIRFGGRRWTCRPKNFNREVDGQYVNWQWRCAARGGRVSRYRWLAGD